LHGEAHHIVQQALAQCWICTLADAIAKNARAIREDRHEKIVDASLLWARAIDLCNAWMRAPRSSHADEQAIDL
jgi:hypothetical protein